MDDQGTPSPPTVGSVLDGALAVERQMLALVSADLGASSEAEIEALGPVVERVSRLVPVVQQAIARQVGERDIHGRHGCRTVVQYLQARLRLRRSEASARVAAMQRFQPCTAMTGEQLPPSFPAVADALGEGAVSMDHASIIADAVERLPDAVSDTDKAGAERFLTQAARDHDPCVVGRLAARIAEHLDPDGRLATEEDQENRQEFTLVKSSGSHGMYRASGWFTPEAAATIEASLSLLSKPAQQPDGQRDPRPAARRRAEALATVCGWSLDHPGQATSGGSRPQVAVTVTLAELRQRSGLGWTDLGDPVSAQTLQRMMCDAHTALSIFSNRGEVLFHGRDKRTITPGLRRALSARDKGCAFTGCDTPPWWCDGHHLLAWADGGRTDVDNTALTCRHHHVLLHRGHWRMVMLNGVPHTIAPAWLDPTQTPRRNTTHDPP